MKAEAPVHDALNIAKLLVALVRQMSIEAPDILPYVESVPAGVLPVFDEETLCSTKPRVGFRTSGR